MGITLESGGDCAYSSTELGLRVTFSNRGQAGAGAFVLAVNTTRKVIAEGLTAGEIRSIWLPTFVYLGENVAIVDADNTVTESNETNNQLVQFVPIPTLPPTCTPTPTHTPTVTPTPTGTATLSAQLPARVYLPMVVQ
jgi:hypothetical protein